MPSYDPNLFNVDPYYDDFNEDKKFLRLMFRPGYAVQARELTQLQTLLQNQIERFGSHVFEEGSIVIDGQITENRVKYAKISSPNTVPSDFIGTVLYGTDRASARVVHAEGGLTGSNLEDETTVLFFEYLEGGNEFGVNDIVQATADTGIGITGSITGPNGFVIGNALVASVERGVRFVEGYFVLNDAQSIGAYELTGSAGNEIRNYDNPTTRIGFDVEKTFVTAIQDESLNDPAFGFYNYAAPGSDRFAMQLNIAQKDFDPQDNSAVENFSRVGFIEFMRVVDGDIIKVEKYPDYAALEDTLARRTYDESGNYTVVPFELTLKGPTSAGSQVVLKAEMSPGKAYVFGYEFETQGVSRLNIPCARGESHERSVIRDFNRSAGAFTRVEFSGINDSFGNTASFEMHPRVILSTGLTGTNCSSIGSARIRSVNPYSASVFDLSIYDISMTGGKFDDVTRIFMPHNSTNSRHLFTLTGGEGLQNEKDGCLLYQVPEGSGVTSFFSGDYAIVSYFERTASAGTTTFNIDTFSKSGAAQMQFPIPLGQEITLPNADLVVFDENGKVLGGTAEKSSETRISVTVNNATTGKKMFIVATQESANDLEFLSPISGYLRTKSLVTVSESLTGAFGAALTGDERGTTNDTLYLNGYTDVIEVLSLTGTKGASSGISLLEYFNFDNGQRDSHYDWSRLFLSSGVTGITGPFSATFRRYSHSGSYGPFTVASYPDYENIPTYNSKSTGTVYSLRDCIDFRPIRGLNGNMGANTWIPANTAANDNDFGYVHYMPRTDKIVLTRDRKFAVISGIPSLNGEIPNDDPNAMTLYTVRVNPYTFTNSDSSIRYIENKRYTMRDIGDLEKRIEAVEYYTTLNILEQEAKAKSIRDIDGDEMPKKGILVDQFKGHVVADNTDPMFAASVDYERNELRPQFTTESYSLSVNDITDVTGNSEDGIYTLEYETSPEISNILASGTVQINPFSVINYMGSLKISPSTDNWFNTNERPVVRVNVSGENDNWIESPTLGFGTRYNDWESQWFGFENNNFKNLKPNINRKNKLLAAKLEGISLESISSSVAPESMKKTINNKTVERNVLPYARRKAIAITATGLKPNTAYKVYCNDIDVSGFLCTLPTLNGLNQCTGSPITGITDEYGEVSGIYLHFNHPSMAEKFLVGRHTIRIIDSTADINNPATWSMSAEATYVVQGAYNTLSEDGELSTRILETKRKSVKSAKVVSNLLEMLTSSGEIRGYSEPLSQTFYVDPSKYKKGIFVKSVDLYFNTKDVNDAASVTMQIRPTISGYPHPSKILPFADATVYSDEIVELENPIDESGNVQSSATFTFSSPVYLLPGQEYSISISSNSPKFSVFSGYVGSSVIAANDSETPVSVTKQPLVRSLFKAQNTGNMVKVDNESLAFRLNVCKFSPASGEIVLENDSSTETVTYINEYRLNVTNIAPEGTNINSYVSVGGSSEVSTETNKNIIPTQGAIQPSSNGAGDISVVRLEMNTDDQYVSPVFDLERSSFVRVTNLINNNDITDQNDPSYNGEIEPTNAAAASENYKTKARYITKKVTLEEGMEAENITVLMSLNNPISSTGVSRIKVFVRPIPVGEDDLDNVNYVELTTSDSLNSSSTDDFREVSYTNIGSTTLTKFKTFSVKILMLGPQDGSATPKIRNLRVVAT
jgi:hypothetical protein